MPRNRILFMDIVEMPNFTPPPSGNCELNSKVRDHSEFDSRPWQTRWTEFERFVRSYDIDVSNYDEETWNAYVAELGDDVIEYDTAHIEPDCRFESTIPVLSRRRLHLPMRRSYFLEKPLPRHRRARSCRCKSSLRRALYR